MLKGWQFNVLFFVGVGGAILLVVAPAFHWSIGDNPTALAGIGSILTYILTQKKTLTKKSESEGKHRKGNAHDSDESNEEGEM